MQPFAGSRVSGNLRVKLRIGSNASNNTISLLSIVQVPNIRMQMLFPEDLACRTLAGTVIDWTLEQSNTTVDVSIATPPQVVAISLGHGSSLPREFRAEQLNDADVEPVIKWMEENVDKPPWEVIAPHNRTAKVYCT